MVAIASALHPFDAEFTQTHLSLAADKVREAFVYSASSIRACGTESPIEAAFYIWWTALDTLRAVDDLDLVPQAEVVTSAGERYRVDFEIQAHPCVTNERVVPRVAVELDGHDFHERTREQVSQRNTRDRALLSDGWTVLHFSGSEFHRAPLTCVYEVVRTARRLFAQEATTA